MSEGNGPSKRRALRLIPLLLLATGVVYALPPLGNAPLARAQAEGITEHHQILYDNGTPVGGYTQLTIYPDGSYNWEGHAHVSGAPSYDYSAVALVHTASGKVYTFTHTGRVHGTFEPGSRDSDWHEVGQDDRLIEAYTEIDQAPHLSFECNLAVQSMLDNALKALGVVSTVITIVGVIL